MARQLKSGPGWRLGWDPDASEFAGLVGGDHWAIELTGAELNDFCHMVLQLANTMAQMATELMSDEKITCEAEGDRLWLEASGYPQAYDLSLILLTGRRGEGSWPAEVVPELVKAVQTLKVF
jgi:hypothetical protein